MRLLDLPANVLDAGMAILLVVPAQLSAHLIRFHRAHLLLPFLQRFDTLRVHVPVLKFAISLALRKKPIISWIESLLQCLNSPINLSLKRINFLNAQRFFAQPFGFASCHSPCLDSIFGALSLFLLLSFCGRRRGCWT